jgi:multiple sugar transport system substrate-binding protein
MSHDAFAPRLSRRRLTWLAGVALTVSPALLAACGAPPAAPTTAPKAAEPAKAAEPTKPAAPAAATQAAVKPAAGAKTYKITFANDWNTGIRQETVKLAISEFQKLNPNVTIEALQLGSGAGTSNQGGLVEVVVAQFVAGQAPDVIFGWPEMVPIWNTYLADLTPLWRDKKGDDLGIIDHPLITHYQGKRMAVDFAPSVSGWFINTSMFEKAGIPVPTEEWTWEQQLDAARKLTTTDGKQWGMWFRRSWDLDFWQYVAANMTERTYYADKEETKVGYNTPEALEGFQWFVDLIHKHKVAPSPAAAAAMKTAETADLFMLGIAGMTAAHYQSTGDVVRFIKDKFKWKLMPPPRAPKNSKPFHGGQTEPNSVSKDAEKKGNLEPAFDFALFLGGNEALQKYIAEPANRPTFPVKKSVLNSPAILQPPPENMGMAVKQLEDAPNALSFRYPKKYWAEWMQTVITEADRAMIGEATAEQAWKSLVEKTQKVMDANK